MGRWRRQTAKTLESAFFAELTSVMNRSRAPFIHLSNFLKVKFPSSVPGHLAQLVCGKAASIQEEFENMLFGHLAVFGALISWYRDTETYFPFFVHSTTPEYCHNRGSCLPELNFELTWFKSTYYVLGFGFSATSQVDLTSSRLIQISTSPWKMHHCWQRLQHHRFCTTHQHLLEGWLNPSTGTLTGSCCWGECQIGKTVVWEGR